jgi:hypothetical protein
MRKTVFRAATAFVSGAAILGCGSEPPTEPVVVGVRGPTAGATVDDELRDLGFVNAGLPAKRQNDQTATLYEHADGRRAVRIVDDAGFVIAIVFDQKGERSFVLGAPAAGGIRAQDFGWACYSIAMLACLTECDRVSRADETSNDVCYPGCEYEVFRICAIWASNLGS